MPRSVLHLHQHGTMAARETCEPASTPAMRPSPPALERSARERERERRLDEELAQSFPASDPPSWVQGKSR